MYLTGQNFDDPPGEGKNFDDPPPPQMHLKLFVPTPHK